MDELVLPLPTCKKKVKTECDQHYDRLEDNACIRSLMRDATGDPSTNHYTAAASGEQEKRQKQQEKQQPVILLNEEDDKRVEESRHRGGGKNIVTAVTKTMGVFVRVAPPPAAGRVQLVETKCCTSSSRTSGTTKRTSSPPPENDEQQQRSEGIIMDVSIKEEEQAEAKEEQELENNKNKDSVDPLQQLTSYQQKENKQQEHEQLDLLTELNDDSYSKTSTSSTPRSSNKKRKILAPPQTEEEKDDRDDSKLSIDDEASKHMSTSTRNKLLTATNSIAAAPAPPGIGRPPTTDSAHKDDSSTGDQAREDDQEQESDTNLIEDDEEDIITINVSLAQQKMMRFFFGAAADKTAKYDGMNDQVDEMKDRKLTTKQDATNRRMYIRFPHKLMYTLECGDYSNILSWNFNGTSFKIEDRDLFEMKVLPEIYKDAKFSSFRRKLNRWYFKRHRSERVFTVSHPYFRRGNYSLCDLMVCGDSKQCDLQQPGRLESIPPPFAVLGKQEAVCGQQETSRLVDHSVMDHVTQSKCNILGQQQYPKFYTQNNKVTTTAAASSVFYPTTAMAPPRFDPVTSSTGLLLHHQDAPGHGISLVPNDYHGSVAMQPNHMIKSSPWWLNGTPTTTNSSVNTFPSSYSSSVLFDNITAVGDSSLPGTSSRIPVSSGQSFDARHDGSVLPSESSFQVIYPGSNQNLSSSGYLPAAQTLPPEYVVGNGISASLLSANRPFSNIDSNYFWTPRQMNNTNFDYNFGMNASFDNSLSRIGTVAQIIVPTSYRSQPGTTAYNIGAGHDSHYLLPTNTRNTVRMPPFAMSALPQQQQPLNPGQRRPPGTRDNVKDSMAK